MAEKMEFFVSPSAQSNTVPFVMIEELEGALPYLEHLMEDYETQDPLVVFSILYHYVLPTLQEQLMLHDEIGETLLFPEVFNANLQREIRIVGFLLHYFESTVLEKQSAVLEEKHPE
jgi:hypothetical protein